MCCVPCCKQMLITLVYSSGVIDSSKNLLFKETEKYIENLYELLIVHQSLPK